MAPNVPFPRPIHRGTKGLDVVAVKRALSRAGYMQWGDFTDVAGDFFFKASSSFAKANGFKAPKNTYDLLLHNVLEKTHCKGKPREWAFDGYSISLMQQEASVLAETPDERVRDHIIQAARYWVSVRSLIGYAQVRPVPRLKPPAYPRFTDCSGFATMCYYAAGVPDPNGRGYDGQGYTGTLMNRGHRISRSQLKPGDLVFCGFTTRPSPAFPYGSPTHVAVWLGSNLVASHGSQSGPQILPVSVFHVNHYRQYQLT